VNIGTSNFFVAFSKEVKKSLELLYSSRSRFKVLKPLQFCIAED
jgi:hypothetical protein